MAFLNEEQSILRDQAKAWIRSNAPVSALRKLRDEGVGDGFDPHTWDAMVELGWPGLLIPETHGGSGQGYFTFGLILEELGRQLVASPLLGSSFIGVSALLAADDEAHNQTLLPQVAQGDAILALAIDEGAHHNPHGIGTRASASGNGFILSGAKTLVFEGMAATHYIVVAHGDEHASPHDGLILFVIPAQSPGLTRQPLQTMDSRGYARVELDRVSVDAGAILGPAHNAGSLLQQILNRAVAGLSAEMLGAASQAFEMTLDYLKTRKQFGEAIGGFQALGHRAATLFSAMESSRSCVEAALQAIDARARDSDQLSAMAKVKAGDFLYTMSNELIQMHGGIGMTDDFDAGLYLKRARVLELALGNRAFHRNRYAKLLGF